jgi:hypothetical protein
MSTFNNQDWIPTRPQKSKETRNKIIAALVGLALGLTVIFGGISIMKSVSHDAKTVAAATDSGVQACSNMVKNANKPDSGSSSAMTQADFDKAVKPFKESRYADIKTAGVNLVTTIYNMDKASQTDTDDSADLSGAMGGLMQVTTYYAQLQTACSAHGVDIPPLNSKG